MNLLRPTGRPDLWELQQDALQICLTNVVGSEFASLEKDSVKLHFLMKEYGNFTLFLWISAAETSNYSYNELLMSLLVWGQSNKTNLSRKASGNRFECVFSEDGTCSWRSLRTPGYRWARIAMLGITLFTVLEFLPDFCSFPNQLEQDSAREMFIAVALAVVLFF